MSYNPSYPSYDILSDGGKVYQPDPYANQLACVEEFDDLLFTAELKRDVSNLSGLLLDSNTFNVSDDICLSDLYSTPALPHDTIFTSSTSSTSSSSSFTPPSPSASPTSTGAASFIFTDTGCEAARSIFTKRNIGHLIKLGVGWNRTHQKAIHDLIFGKRQVIQYFLDFTLSALTLEADKEFTPALDNGKPMFTMQNWELFTKQQIPWLIALHDVIVNRIKYLIELLNMGAISHFYWSEEFDLRILLGVIMTSDKRLDINSAPSPEPVSSPEPDAPRNKKRNTRGQ